jgi:thiamine pyrophosphate-dependent acetolactate synthase large subunit-like protein
MCFPGDHPGWLGLRFGMDTAVETADVIVVLDCDTPWIPSKCKPREDAKIYHIDVDPLKHQMPVFYIQSNARYRADALTSIKQITHELTDGATASKLQSNEQEEMAARLKKEQEERLAVLDKKSEPLDEDAFGSSILARKLRDLCPEDTIWAIEAVTNTVFIHDQLRPTLPGSWINCGGGGLGWSGGAALGIKLATDAENGGRNKGKFVVQIVGDGSYLFSVPGSVYWIAERYQIPVLTIVLNNKGKHAQRQTMRISFADREPLLGWHAPRRSLLLVHPDGEASKASNDDINIAFNPSPDYAGIAKAASGGGIHAARVDKASELQGVLEEAISKVKAGQCAVVDCKVVSGC